MNTAPMIAAICNTTTRLRQVETLGDLDSLTVREAAKLLRTLRRLIEGDPVIAAFGEPSTWGRDSEICAALVELRKGTCAARADSRKAGGPAAGAEAPPMWLVVLYVLSCEIARGSFRLPYRIENIDGQRVLCIRTSHVVAHIARTASALELMMGVPLPSAVMLTKRLRRTGVLLTTSNGHAPQPLERTCEGERVSNMVGILLDQVCAAAADFGLPITAPFQAQ